jgi:hypothetical protein
MTWDAIAEASAAAVFQQLGKAVSYHHHTGVVCTAQAIIDKGVEVFPGGFDTGVAERRTEVSLLWTDAARAQRGEKIIDGDTAYVIEDIIEDDGIEIRVAVRET